MAGLDHGDVEPQGRTRLRCVVRWEGDRRRTMYVLAIYPSLMITLTPGYFWYLSLHPQGVDKVRIMFGGGMSPDYVNDPEAQVHFNA